MGLKFMGSGDRDTLLQSRWLGMCVAEGELGVPAHLQLPASR